MAGNVPGNLDCQCQRKTHGRKGACALENDVALADDFCGPALDCRRAGARRFGRAAGSVVAYLEVALRQLGIFVVHPAFAGWELSKVSLSVQIGAVGDDSGNNSRAGRFDTTRWSVVLRASDGAAGAAREALEALCAVYWYPIYAFARRQGRAAEDAQDLTQEFFARFLSRQGFSLANPDRGRLRNFLLASFKRFAAEEWRRANRQKRGGGATALSLDAERAEERYASEPQDGQSPDRVYERRWAEAVLARALEQLQRDYDSTGRADLYRNLQQFLWGREPTQSYADMGQRLGLAEGAVKVAVHRLRQRFRDVLREEVANTVDSPDQVEEELKTLFLAFAPG